MITEKDSDAISSPEELLSKMFRDIREIGYRPNQLRLIEESHDACINLIKQYEERIRAESADQARKEAADRVASAWRVYEEDITLRILQEAILGDSAPVSTDSEKLAIAVKALEEIVILGTHKTLPGRSLNGERRESETITNQYAVRAEIALKEIQQ